MEQKVRILIDSLIQKTKSRTTNWFKEESNEGIRFALSLSASTIYVSRDFTLSKGVLYQFWLKNPQSETLVYLGKDESQKNSSLPESKDFELLKKLVEEVRTAYFGIDIIVDELLQECRVEGKIGKGERSFFNT
ncbi:MAG: hypothetical protein RL662_1025 [Bacteroidota bacterium]